MQRVDFSQFTGSFNKITMSGLQNLTNARPAQLQVDQRKGDAEYLPETGEAWILPKDFNPSNSLAGGDANPALEVVYE